MDRRVSKRKSAQGGEQDRGGQNREEMEAGRGQIWPRRGWVWQQWHIPKSNPLPRPNPPLQIKMDFLH